MLARATSPPTTRRYWWTCRSTEVRSASVVGFCTVGLLYRRPSVPSASNQGPSPARSWAIRLLASIRAGWLSIAAQALVIGPIQIDGSLSERRPLLLRRLCAQVHQRSDEARV